MSLRKEDELRSLCLWHPLSCPFMRFRKHKCLRKRQDNQLPFLPAKHRGPRNSKDLVFSVHHPHIPSVLQIFIIPIALLNF